MAKPAEAAEYGNLSSLIPGWSGRFAPPTRARKTIRSYGERVRLREVFAPGNFGVTSPTSPVTTSSVTARAGGSCATQRLRGWVAAQPVPFAGPAGNLRRVAQRLSGLDRRTPTAPRLRRLTRYARPQRLPQLCAQVQDLGTNLARHDARISDRGALVELMAKSTLAPIK